MWEVRIQHGGLHAYRVVKGATQTEANYKASLQLAKWKETWEKRTQAHLGRLEKLNQQLTAQQRKLSAIQLTAEAEARIAEIESLLTRAVERGVFFEWNDLKDRTEFPDPPLALRSSDPLPPEPERAAYDAKLSFIAKLIPDLRRKKSSESEQAYAEGISAWRQKCGDLATLNSALETRNAELTAERTRREERYLRERAAQHQQIDAIEAAAQSGDAESVQYFFSEVLDRSESSEAFPKESRIQYLADAATLVVDLELPNPNALPVHKEVKYIASRNELQEVNVSEAWKKKTYDDVIYKLALKTVHEILLHDSQSAVQSIALNGWVRSIDRATGAEAHACIISFHVPRAEFVQINLAQVDPRSCFRKLKGVGSSKLIELTAIRPVISVSRDDHRFIDSYSVLESVDDRVNLAAMDWQDFENLIRELFEMEFSKSGGEVKITQASRDGGVDAVAFDPDPIRGGKIVIQAKRYTNVVGVAAVRDLYGTVHNEGATKGILVTTSTYGPDAYEFAKGKPLTLLSGSELLYLLEEHGRKSRIDLAGAKRSLREVARK